MRPSVKDGGGARWDEARIHVDTGNVLDFVIFAQSNSQHRTSTDHVAARVLSIQQAAGELDRGWAVCVVLGACGEDLHLEGVRRARVVSESVFVWDLERDVERRISTAIGC
eukprot:scaffold31871_cov72-Phaeocystis_antarctica.AAC.2